MSPKETLVYDEVTAGEDASPSANPSREGDLNREHGRSEEVELPGTCPVAADESEWMRDRVVDLIASTRFVTPALGRVQ